MKGLLLKDWYMMKQYCRTYPVIAVAFMALSLVDSDNLFFVFYPCLLCGMIPVTLLGYDERSGWVQYSGTMPYTKIQIDSEKYLVCPTYDARRYGNCASGKNDADGRFYPWGFCRSDAADVDGVNARVLHPASVYFQDGCGKRKGGLLCDDWFCVRRKCFDIRFS